VKDEKHFIAIEQCAAGRLFNIVVENEHVSKLLLKDKCTNMHVTYIPNNKIVSPLTQDQVNRITQTFGGKAILAKELISYDPKYENTMNFVFGSTVIIFFLILCLVHLLGSEDCQGDCFRGAAQMQSNHRPRRRLQQQWDPAGRLHGQQGSETQADGRLFQSQG